MNKNRQINGRTYGLVRDIPFSLNDKGSVKTAKPSPITKESEPKPKVVIEAPAVIIPKGLDFSMIANEWVEDEITMILNLIANLAAGDNEFLINKKDLLDNELAHETICRVLVDTQTVKQARLSTEGIYCSL